MTKREYRRLKHLKISKALLKLKSTFKQTYAPNFTSVHNHEWFRENPVQNKYI